MVNGRLVCLGSASQLKAAHGYGSLGPIRAGYGLLFLFFPLFLVPCVVVFSSKYFIGSSFGTGCEFVRLCDAGRISLFPSMPKRIRLECRAAACKDGTQNNVSQNPNFVMKPLS